MIPRSLLPLLVLAAVLGAFPTVHADELASQRMGNKRPVLGPHRFVTNELTREAFPRTYVQTRLGVGQALDVNLVPEFILSNGDTIKGLTGDLAAAILEVDYQFALKDWMGIWATVNMLGRLGTNTGALLSEGATVLTGFEMGWLVRLLEREKFYLSGTVNVLSNGFTGVNLASWAEGILQGENVPLVRKVPSVRAAVGLRFAWAINDLYGLNVATRLGRGEGLSNRDKDLTSFRVAVVGDVDLFARTRVPIGFALGGGFSNAPRDGDDQIDRVWQGLLRISYTGRDDFLLSIDNEISRLSDSGGEAFSTATILASLRYYF